MKKRYLAIALSFGLAATTLVGCASGDESTKAEFKVSKNSELADKVPQEIRDAGVLKVATDPTYPPFESVSEDNTIVGLDADLGHALGELLDLKVEFQSVSFDAIIPALQAGNVDMALASIGDSKEREEVVDFATAYWNGTMLLTKEGNPLGGTPELACGMNIGVVRGSLQQTTFLPAHAEPCKKIGKPAPVEFAFQNSNQAALALGNGRIDGVLADAPAVAQVISQTQGMEAVGPIQRNPNPAGAAFQKDSKLAPLVAEALNQLIESGVYKQILDKWELGDIAIETSEINGAQE